MDPGRTGAKAIVIVVPDASVLLKWVVAGDDEPYTGAALSLRDEAVSGTIELLVPQLWIYEVGNTLARRFPEQADELLASLVDFGMTEWRLDPGWRAQAVSLGRHVRRLVPRCGLPCHGARRQRRVRHGGTSDTSAVRRRPGA